MPFPPTAPFCNLGSLILGKSFPETAPPVGLLGWLRPVTSERSLRRRSAITLPSAKLDRRTSGSDGRGSRPRPLQSDLLPPNPAALPSPALPQWRRYSPRLEISIPAARRIRASGRTRSAPPSGSQSCDPPSADLRRLACKWLRACAFRFSCTR